MALAGSGRGRHHAGMMPCPRCSTHLHGVRTPAGAVWDCPRGHGRYALLPVLRGLHRKSELDAAWQAAFWGRLQTGCTCPSCGKVMREIDVAGFNLDVCRRCQALWLDHAEVRTLPPVLREEPIIAAQEVNARKAMAMAIALTHLGGAAIGAGLSWWWGRGPEALGSRSSGRSSAC